MGYYLEFREGVPSEEGVASSHERRDMYGDLLGMVIIWCSKDHVQGNFFAAVCFLPSDYTFRGSAPLFYARLINVHPIQSVCVY